MEINIRNNNLIFTNRIVSIIIRLQMYKKDMKREKNDRYFNKINMFIEQKPKNHCLKTNVIVDQFIFFS